MAKVITLWWEASPAATVVTWSDGVCLKPGVVPIEGRSYGQIPITDLEVRDRRVCGLCGGRPVYAGGWLEDGFTAHVEFGAQRRSAKCAVAAMWWEADHEAHHERELAWRAAAAKEGEGGDESDVDLRDLYVLRNPVTRFVKVGISQDVARRKRTIDMACGVLTEVLCTMASGARYERGLHRKLSAYRKHGEWFELPPKVERWLILRIKAGDRLPWALPTNPV
jgi:hypothetical protein